MPRVLSPLLLMVGLGLGLGSDLADAKACPCASLLLFVDPDPPVSGETVEIKAYLTWSEAGEPMSPYRGVVRVELEGSALPESLTLMADRDPLDRYVARVRLTRAGQLFVVLSAGNIVFRGPAAGTRYSYRVIGGDSSSSTNRPLDARGSGLMFVALIALAVVASLWLRLCRLRVV